MYYTISEVQFTIYDNSQVFDIVNLFWRFVVQIYGYIFVFSSLLPCDHHNFRFLFVKVLLLSFAQFDTLLISMFQKFSASRTVSGHTAIIKSLATAIAFVHSPNSGLSNELYW